jgi:integrase
VSVYRKGRIFHYDFVHRGRRHHGSTGQDTRRAAEAVERKRRLEAATGVGEDAGDLTLDLALSRYLDEVGPTIRDRDGLERRLLIAGRCVGKTKILREIDAAAITAAISKRRAMSRDFAVAPATINRDLIDHTLRPLLNRARRVWGARNMPEIEWKSLRLKEPKGIVCEYTQEQIAAWRDQLDPAPRLALDLMLTYGLRFGELFFASADVDGAGQRLHLRNRKAGDSLTIPLLPEHARILAAVASTRAPEETVFAFGYWGLYSRIRTAAERAGLGARAIHGARHHAATTLLRATGNLKLTQRMLGHASIQSTMRYAHASEDDLRSALSALPRHSPEVGTPRTSKIRKGQRKNAVGD